MVVSCEFLRVIKIMDDEGKTKFRSNPGALKLMHVDASLREHLA